MSTHDPLNCLCHSLSTYAVATCDCSCHTAQDDPATDYVVTYTSMTVTATDAEHAIARAESQGGGHWEAVPVTRHPAPLAGTDSERDERLSAYLDAHDSLESRGDEIDRIVVASGTHRLTAADLRHLLASLAEQAANSQVVRGWVIVDPATGDVDWDGKVHETDVAAHLALRAYGDTVETTAVRREYYEVLPVLAAEAADPARLPQTAQEN